MAAAEAAAVHAAAASTTTTTMAAAAHQPRPRLGDGGASLSREMLGCFQSADGAATSGPGHHKPLVSYAPGKDRGSRGRVLPAARLEQTLGDHLRVTLHGGDDTQDVRVLGRQGKVIVERVQTRCPLRGADGVCCHVRPQPLAPAPGT